MKKQQETKNFTQHTTQNRENIKMVTEFTDSIELLKAIQQAGYNIETQATPCVHCGYVGYLNYDQYAEDLNCAMCGESTNLNDQVNFTN